MSFIYYGCMTKNSDGTNRLIGPGEKCLVPTDKWFRIDPCDIKTDKVKTRSYTKKEPAVSIEAFGNYMKQKQWISQWIIGSEQKGN